MSQKEVIKLELLDIQQDPGADGVAEVRLRTNDGTISCRYHTTADRGPAVLWVVGTHGGTAGPADGMFERLADRLVSDNIASLRLDYRRPGRLIDCVLDVLLGTGFLRNQGHGRIVLVGHSFGGSVVINAGASSPSVVAVAALSSQLTGADDIAELSPRPVLLMHGTSDEVRSDVGSRELFELAADPKELVLYPGCGHDLDECRVKIEQDLLVWLHRVAASEPLVS
jgi:alpha-beta hydrolase superfamily lysophospholipase